MYGSEGSKYNVVCNYYKYRPSTKETVRYRVLNPYKSETLPYGKYFVSGNYVDGSPERTADNWLAVDLNGGKAENRAQARADKPFELGSAGTQTAEQAYEAVLAGAGAIRPRRDTLDERIVRQVRQRTGRIIDVQGGYPHGTPYSTSQSAWPVLTCGPAPTDTDHDGMPDAWEQQNGLNPNDAADRSRIGAGGYTMLENYLNGLTAAVTGAKASKAAGEVLVAYPNPAAGQLTLTHPLASRTARITVYDFNGRIVADAAAQSGATESPLRLDALARGNYLILFADEQLRLTTKVLKR